MLDECLDRGREKVRKEVEEGGEWGEIDNFLGGTGEIRELRIKTGPSKGIRLAIGEELEQAGRRDQGERR